MKKIKLEVDMAKMPLDGTVAVDSDEIKEIVEDGEHTWIRLCNRRSYRTSLSSLDIEAKIQEAREREGDTIGSDTICQTRAERLKSVRQRCQKQEPNKNRLDDYKSNESKD